MVLKIVLLDDSHELEVKAASLVIVSGGRSICIWVSVTFATSSNVQFDSSE
jgi:hypothetical protein